MFCIQFLVKCVLSGEAKGRHAYGTRVSHLSKGRRAYRTCVSHLSKGRRMLWRHVSLLLNMHKKEESLQIILHRNAPCASTRCARWNVYAKRMCTNGHAAARLKKHCVEHKLLEFFDTVVSHGFKSIVACVLVGKVGLNFYTVLDEAS
jgi:hypothetical protein